MTGFKDLQDNIHHSDRSALKRQKENVSKGTFESTPENIIYNHLAFMLLFSVQMEWSFLSARDSRVSAISLG